MYSIVIPSRNEAKNLPGTINGLHGALVHSKIPHEIILVNDHSVDNTTQVVSQLAGKGIKIKEFPNPGEAGFGNAVRYGIDQVSGDIVAFVMADGSDDPHDVVMFYQKIIEEGVDCCFGTRWSMGGSAHDYPLHKMIINRIVNYGLMLAFGIKCNDITNAFKAYKKETIDAVQPLFSRHFNLTVEIPLKAVIRGFSYTVQPNKWKNRKHGTAHLKLEEMGSRYLFIVLYCLLEKWLSRGDYFRK